MKLTTSQPKTNCKNLLFSPKSWKNMVQYYPIMCKTSLVKCPLIPLNDPQPMSWSTLNGHLDRHSVNTHSTPNQHLYCTWLTLHKQSVDSQLGVDRLICIDQFDTQWHVCENELWLSTNCRPRCCSNVKQVSTEVSVKFRLSVNQGYQSTLNCGCP